MALLATFGGRRRAVGVGLALVSAGAGCALLSLERGERPLAFDHRRHVVEQELECVICHEDAYHADAPGLPGPDTCMLCHEELDAERPSERRVETLFADGVFRAAHHSALPDEVVFSHARHVGAELECGACHAGIETNRSLTPAIGVRMDACIACHEERGQGRDCATCHTLVGPDWRPPSHDRMWERRHGEASRRCERNAPDDCTQCHAASACADCHQSEPPASHTSTFRRRTHGLVAAIDRASCAACHRSDACESCHSETRPTSHVGAWGGTRSRHCLTCHLPVRGNGCIVCHKGTPSHLAANPKPDWHDPAMNCRQCHGISAPLPHVDKGDDCNACHF